MTTLEERVATAAWATVTRRRLRTPVPAPQPGNATAKRTQLTAAASHDSKPAPHRPDTGRAGTARIRLTTEAA